VEGSAVRSKQIGRVRKITPVRLALLQSEVSRCLPSSPESLDLPPLHPLLTPMDS